MCISMGSLKLYLFRRYQRKQLCLRPANLQTKSSDLGGKQVLICGLVWFCGTLYALSGDTQELEKWWGQAPSLPGSLSDGKSGPRETVLRILGTTWRTRFVTPSIGQLFRTEHWLWCYKDVAEKSDLGRVEGVVTGEMSGNIFSHQEMIIMFQRHRNQPCLIKYCASPSRHTNKNLTLITWVLFCFFHWHFYEHWRIKLNKPVKSHRQQSICGYSQ